jgi:hypothetical protein
MIKPLYKVTGLPQIYFIEASILFFLINQCGFIGRYLAGDHLFSSLIFSVYKHNAGVLLPLRVIHQQNIFNIKTP